MQRQCPTELILHRLSRLFGEIDTRERSGRRRTSYQLRLLLQSKNLLSALPSCFNRLLSLTTSLRLHWVTALWVLAVQREFSLLLHFFKQNWVSLLADHFIKVWIVCTFSHATNYGWSYIVPAHSTSSLKDISCFVMRLLLPKALILFQMHL